MELNKEKLIVEQAQGDITHFGVLFDQYYPVILNYAARRTGDSAIAQDITAETFYKAMTNLHKFKWQGVSISNWFYRIATNEIRMFYRRSKYQPVSLDALFDGGLEVADKRSFTQEIMDAQDAMERHQEFMQAQAAIARLPIKYQEVIMLRFTEKKKLSEIAVILGKKEGTVKSLLSRGLSKLKRELQQRQMQPNKTSSIIASGGQTLITTQEAYED